MNPQPQTDAELVQQLKNGILAAGSVLYERHRRPIHAFCLRMTHDSAAAQDAAQETFLKMLSRVHTIEQGITLRSWLFTTARNEVLMVMRRGRTVPMDPLEDADTVIDAGTPLRTTEGVETSAIIETAVAQLRPLYREAFLLREHEGMSYDEIAAVTGASLTAVKSRIFKARLALQTILTPYMDKGAL